MAMDDKFFRYSALDSACMMEIYQKFWPTIANGYQATYDMTMNLMPVLAFMQTKGIAVDHTKLEETRREVLQRAAEREADLHTLCGFPLNVNSGKQVAEYFYLTLGLPPILKPKTKAITTDDLAMQRLVRGTAKHPGRPEAKLIQEIRGLKKLYSTYLSIEFDADNRMRGAYNPRGTMYGRLSSSKTIFGTGMNMQNLPPDFKKFLVADPGYVLVEFDKRQAEWVVVAYASDDSNMIRAIEQGLDVHAYTASLMFHVPMEVVAHENDVIGHVTNPDQIKELRQTDDILRQHDTTGWPRSMTLRQCGKKSNHGLNYDEGPNTFALTNEIEIGEAKKIITMYHEGYPSIRKWYDHIQRQLKASRTLENCFGRRVKFMGEWGTDLWKSSYSMIPQSTVVDSLNSGMVKVYNDPLLAREYNIDILAQVHDSILVQIPIEVMQDETKYNEVMRRVNEYTSPTLTYNGNDFRIATDAKIGFNWGGKHKVHNYDGMRDCKSYDDVRALLQLRGAAHVEGIERLA